MTSHTGPWISPNQTLPEITFRVVVLAILLAFILAIANTYLALKIGILTSASIPAAIISMGILRLFKDANILENNLVQTAASAGEAIAGGIAYTIPALIILHYWDHFSYWENFYIALIGSFLGIMFSIPLRQVLMTERYLHFPEGKAVAEVLKAGTHKAFGIREMVLGGVIGASAELCQAGFKVIASGMQGWFAGARMLFGFGTGFSATMIGAGYLIGFNVGLSILLGAIVGWGICVPVLSSFNVALWQGVDPSQAVLNLWEAKIRFIGIGAMLVAGIWTLLLLCKPLLISLRSSLEFFKRPDQQKFYNVPRTEQDIPFHYVVIAIIFLMLLCFWLFYNTLPLNEIGFPPGWHVPFIVVSLLYILIIGFIFAGICSYFSGLVGVSATPGSGMVIAGLLITATLLRFLLTIPGISGNISQQLPQAAAITIIIGAILTGIACIANDNIQDLKVGHILGATPWKQQLMLLLGALVASAVVAPTMQLLFNVYGIVGVLPHSGMDPTLTLPAPPAAMMAAITQGVFNGNLPWDMILVGGIIAICFILLNALLKLRGMGLSVLGTAIGIYLPLMISTSLFIGGLFAFCVDRALLRYAKKKAIDEKVLGQARQGGLLLACGLVTGSALMDVGLAIPFALARSPNALQINLANWDFPSKVLGLIFVVSLGFGFYKVVMRKLKALR